MRLPGPLVDTGWLSSHLTAVDLRVLDVRWYLDPARNGRTAFLESHVPGAGFLDLDADLSAPGGRRGGPAGRHPWPPPDQVERVLSAAGVGPETAVVAYDDAAGGIAARLWYTLRAHGHDRVALLDGGLTRWLAEGRPIESGEGVRPPAARFEARLRDGWVLGKDEVLGQLGVALVLDARAPERYRGDTEPVDPRAGHIPGARNAPFTGNLTPGEAPGFKPAAELRERFLSLGAGESQPILYCGSGVTACHDLFALELAGLRGRLYAGSWSEWSADPDCPLTTGPQP